MLPVTVKSLMYKFKEDNVFSFSATILKRLLHSISFDFKMDDPRRGLFEQDHIAASRATFLRKYFKNKQEATYDPVYLDETWIFSRGSPRKTWHDSNAKILRKKLLGEGKRFPIELVWANCKEFYNKNIGSRDLAMILLYHCGKHR